MEGRGVDVIREAGRAGGNKLSDSFDGNVRL